MLFFDLGFPESRLERISTIGKLDDQIALKRSEQNPVVGEDASKYLWLDENHNAIPADKLPPEAFESLCDKPSVVEA